MSDYSRQIVQKTDKKDVQVACPKCKDWGQKVMAYPINLGKGIVGPYLRPVIERGPDGKFHDHTMSRFPIPVFRCYNGHQFEVRHDCWCGFKRN